MSLRKYTTEHLRKEIERREKRQIHNVMRERIQEITTHTFANIDNIVEIDCAVDGKEVTYTITIDFERGSD